MILIFAGAMAAQAGPSLSVTLDATTPYAGVTLKNETIYTKARVQSYTNDNLQEELDQGGYVEYKYNFAYGGNGGTRSTPDPNPTAYTTSTSCNTSGYFTGPAGDAGWIQVTVTAHTCYQNGTEIPGSVATKTASIEVDVVEITQSADLWWFNGASPSGYAIAITLTGQPSGTWSWSIVEGDDKVTLQNANSNPVTVISIGKSTPPGNDVLIQPVYNGTALSAYSLTVYAPDYCEILQNYPTDEGWGPYGFRTTYCYILYNQFATTIPNVPINEIIGSFTNDYSPCWGWPDPDTSSGSTNGSGVFTDLYRASVLEVLGHPTTTWPGEYGWDTAVRHAQQWYRAGSSSSGDGYMFNTHTVQLYRGCGRYE